MNSIKGFVVYLGAVAALSTFPLVLIMALSKQLKHNEKE